MILLLAGTSEAKRIAWGLADTGLSVIASLAGATRQPDPLPVKTRVGGFGGEDGFRAFLRDNAISAVLDATHPFACRITDRTARVCAELDLPYTQVLRPGWTPVTGDNWTMIDAPEDAASIIPPAATVFLATGRQTVERYAGLEGRRVLVRVIDPPTAPLPFDGGEFVIGRPPFPPEREEALFRALGVTHLVVKDAGGDAGRSKLDAARAIGLPVVMLRRPPMPVAHRVATVEGALLWVASI